MKKSRDSRATDPVTPDLRRRVLLRDKGCVAAALGFKHVCRDTWGNVHQPTDLDRLTLDHVNDHPMLGKRAPSDEQHLVSLCAFAHFAGWATSHRDVEREYLRMQR
jgi:hypothetical protein